VSCTLGGVLTDWLVRRTGSRRWGRRLVGLAGKGGAAGLMLLAPLTDDPLTALVLLSLSSFLSDLSMAPTWAVCTDAGGRHVGAVFGFVNMFAGVGAVLSPV